jgi:hypothetical protein
MVYKIAISVFAVVVLIMVLLFVPPVRDWFFGNKMWPYATPWDVTKSQILELRTLAEPGDIIVERNLHSWQWMLLCSISNGSSWVHVAIVTDKGKFISMAKKIVEQDFETYRKKQSTDLVLLRPNYASRKDVQKALEYARSRIGTKFDPSFENHDGNCTGLVASALKAGNIQVPMRRAFFVGKPIYGAADFFKIRDARTIWTNRNGLKTQSKNETLARYVH